MALFMLILSNLPRHGSFAQSGVLGKLVKSRKGHLKHWHNGFESGRESLLNQENLR